MSVLQLYNEWSTTYDAVENTTRDLEKMAGQQVLASVEAGAIIELGCGTGKNTAWLAEKATHLTAVDLSEGMLKQARKTINKQHVIFQQADIMQPWLFTDRKADLITCSLILEHIEDIKPIFENVKNHLKENGLFYICELHPFKQYSGSKARFETVEGTKVLPCYVHHLSDYMQSATANQLSIVQVNEWFDNEDRSTIPRLISFLFRK